MEKQIGHSKFKLVCVYSHKSDGTPYALQEKYEYKNIIHYNSTDHIVRSDGLYTIRHDLAFLEMIEHVYRQWKYIDTCILYMNECQKELKIGLWDKSNFRNNKLMDLALKKCHLNVLCLGIEHEAIKESNSK